MIDSTDKTQVPQIKRALHSHILKHKDVLDRKIPIFFAVNKFDKDRAEDCSYWTIELDLGKIMDQQWIIM